MKKILVFSALIVLSACGTAKKSTDATVETIDGMSQADVDRGIQKFPGLTLNDLVEGKKLYENNCGLCHALKKPESESEAEWRKVVPPMVQKANKKNGGVLDAVAEEKILRYVVTMSSK